MSVQRVFWIKQTLKQLDEAAYSGNIGVMELFKFHQKASQKQKDVLQSHIKNKKHKEAWKLVQDVTGVKLHKNVSEAISPDILPKSGAGAEGISLRNCRTVHIMEPYWNNVRLDQVKGRAIRICSHEDLPYEQRLVNIYTYYTVFTDAQIKNLDQSIKTNWSHC